MEKLVEAVEVDDPNSALYQEKAENTLLRKEEELGVDNNNKLERLSKSEYACDIMNVHALKPLAT
ncbi:hypothetical protein B0H14DRAFT_3430484 [Mycena olivaceomarginata]|nr:hypothetical protein B0H14DRAFT_3430484 [Mycena olivaceomarginata]